MIGSRTKRWLKTSGFQQGGVHAIQGWDEFVPAFAPFQGRARLAQAPRKRHVHCQIEFVGFLVPLYFSLHKKGFVRTTGPTHTSLIRFHRPSLWP